MRLIIHVRIFLDRVDSIKDWYHRWQFKRVYLKRLKGEKKNLGALSSDAGIEASEYRK